jgi:hypothetical protein
LDKSNFNRIREQKTGYNLFRHKRDGDMRIDNSFEKFLSKQSKEMWEYLLRGE